MHYRVKPKYLILSMVLFTKLLTCSVSFLHDTQILSMVLFTKLLTKPGTFGNPV